MGKEALGGCADLAGKGGKKMPFQKLLRQRGSRRLERTSEGSKWIPKYASCPLGIQARI